MAIQADGKIVTAGSTGDGYADIFALARYTVSGSLDVSFDGDGSLTTIINSADCTAYSVAIQTDGKIVAGGYSMSAANFRDFALARYTSTGVLDNTFDGDGTAILDFGGDESAYGMVLSGYRIYMAGFIFMSSQEGYDFAVAAFHNDGIPLPLSLLSFTANKFGNSVQFNWQTTSEQNTASFITERSVDGRFFSSIGNVPAAGNSSSLRTYAFTDSKPVAGINFYRLKMIDTNGNFSYSKTVMVRFTGVTRLQVFPNPVTDVRNIQATGNEIATVQITDAAGRLMKQQKAALTGNTFLSVDVTSLPKGTYYLILQSGSRKEVAEFIK